MPSVCRPARPGLQFIDVDRPSLDGRDALRRRRFCSGDIPYAAQVRSPSKRRKTHDGHLIRRCCVCARAPRPDRFCQEYNPCSRLRDPHPEARLPRF